MGFFTRTRGIGLKTHTTSRILLLARRQCFSWPLSAYMVPGLMG